MYNFDEEINRRDTYSCKWNVAAHELPMWVADMDFRTAPAITAALNNRVQHGIFGYTDIPEAWQQAYIAWWERRHHWKIAPEWLVYSTGVIPTLSSSIRKLTSPNENVVMLTPVYNTFYNSIINNGRRVLESQLRYAHETYEIDFTDLENKLKDPQTSLMLLCNPHNPIGKIWDRDTLAGIGHLCAQHDVTVISDEVHCDITAPGKEYIPFASVSDECARIAITTIAPTKCFNIAGLQTSAAVIVNPTLRHKVWRALNTDECGEANAFAIEATLAAFNHGESWLEELRAYVQGNKDYVSAFLSSHLPEIKAISSEATYLLWLDISRLTDNSADFCERLRKTTGLYVSAGTQYGGNGRQFLRINLATTRKNVADAMNRLKQGAKICGR